MVAIAHSPEKGSTPENALPLKQAAPKTHTPEWRMQELGHRFYSPKLGRWTSRDPIGEEGGLNVYQLAGNAPLSHIDSLGLFPFTLSSIDDGAEYHACGAFTLPITLSVDPLPSKSGVVVQEMLYVWQHELPDGSVTRSLTLDGETFSSPERYWEAFQIFERTRSSGDVWGHPRWDCTKGELVVIGWARFYDNHEVPGVMGWDETPDEPDDFHHGDSGHTWAAGAPSTTEWRRKWWPTRNRPSSNLVVRRLHVRWDCLNGTQDTEEVSHTVD